MANVKFLSVFEKVVSLVKGSVSKYGKVNNWFIHIKVKFEDDSVNEYKYNNWAKK